MSMTSFSNIQNVAFPGPANEVDRIIFSTSLTTTSTDTIATRLLTTVNFNGLGLPPSYYQVVGIYDYNGRSVWNDLADYGLSGGFTLAPAYFVQATSSSTGIISFQTTQTALVNGGSSFNVDLKIALIIPQGVNLSITDQTLFTTQDITYNSANAYMKIASQGSYVTTGTTTTTIAHNLGYVPFFDVYQIDTNGMRRRYNFMNNQGATADETNIYIYTAVGATSTTVYYRIYYES